MSTHGSSRTVAAWTSVFAAALMMIVGLFQFFAGLVALIDGKNFYVSTPNYFLTFNATTWGWIHLVVGIVVGVAGYFVLTGNIAARSLGIVLAGIQAILTFVWLPYYPLWGIVIITLDVLVIWALATLRLDQDAP
ncbi:MAG: DUF7144 family membrane protein [Dermatophilaceae bacterium]